jgi:hypothetical protein
MQKALNTYKGKKEGKRLGNVFIADFGLKNRIRTYRVNGTKEDLLKLLNACAEEDAKFVAFPEIKHVHRSEWTVLLEIELSGREGESFDSCS